MVPDEVDSVQLFHTLNKVIGHVNSHPRISSQVLWRQASDKAKGVGTLEIAVADPHTGGSGHMVAFFPEWSGSGVRQPPERLSSPFQKRTAHLYGMKKGLEKNIRILPLKLATWLLDRADADRP